MLWVQYKPHTYDEWQNVLIYSVTTDGHSVTTGASEVDQGWYYYTHTQKWICIGNGWSMLNASNNI